MYSNTRISQVQGELLTIYKMTSETPELIGATVRKKQTMILINRLWYTSEYSQTNH